MAESDDKIECRRVEIATNLNSLNYLLKEAEFRYQQALQKKVQIINQIDALESERENLTQEKLPIDFDNV